MGDTDDEPDGATAKPRRASLMPLAIPRLCAAGCGARGRFPRGRCPQCTRAVEARRGTASDRGYDAAWTAFRPQFVSMLVERGIPPVCGATLPGGPSTTDSRCKAQGLQTFQSTDGSDLHLDHEPPLTPAEREHPAVVCDPLRIQMLCRADHSAKTLRETRR